MRIRLRTRPHTRMCMMRSRPHRLCTTPLSWQRLCNLAPDLDDWLPTLHPLPVQAIKDKHEQRATEAGGGGSDSAQEQRLNAQFLSIRNRTEVEISLGVPGDASAVRPHETILLDITAANPVGEARHSAEFSETLDCEVSCGSPEHVLLLGFCWRHVC